MSRHSRQRYTHGKPLLFELLRSICVFTTLVLTLSNVKIYKILTKMCLCLLQLDLRQSEHDALHRLLEYVKQPAADTGQSLHLGQVAWRQLQIIIAGQYELRRLGQTGVYSTH